MNVNHYVLAFGAAAVLLASACGDGPVEPSLLDQPRVIAVRSPSGAMVPGTSNTLEALVHNVESLSWRSCPIPWIPPNPDLGYDTLTCVFGQADHGTGNPVSFDVPDGTDELYLAIEATGPTGASDELLTTIFRFRVDVPQTPPGPFVLTTMTDDVADGVEPETIEAGSSLRMQAVLDDSHDERAVVNWYTTGGLFEPFRTFGEDPSELTAPDSAGDITIHAVLRNPDGGASWYTQTLLVQEPTP